jgi:hypothetical protein
MAQGDLVRELARFIERISALDRIPQPLHGTSRKWIALAREFHFDGDIEAYFDPV